MPAGAGLFFGSGGTSPFLSKGLAQFRLLFLDKRNALIADEVQQSGTVDHTPVYPREVVKRALELSASAVILVHNHPSGDPAPSDADRRLTVRLNEGAKLLQIQMLDHVIIGSADNGRLPYFSFREAGML